MSEFIKKIKASSSLAFVLCIVFGVIICIWPGAVLVTVCRIAGALILAFGIYSLVLCGKNENSMIRSFQLIAGILLCVLGTWILLVPGTFLRLIPIVIGVVLVYHGIKNLFLHSQVKDASGKSGMIYVILSLIALVFGLIMIFGASFFLKAGMVLVGIGLIYDGISGLFVMRRMGDRHKKLNNEDDIIDVDYKEM